MNIEDYLKSRIQDQRKWYEVKATQNKKQFFRYQKIIIVLGASIPIIVALEPVLDDRVKPYAGPVTAIISAAISIVAGLDKLHQPQPNWFNYRANEEMIKKEEWFYKFKAGPYKDLQDDDVVNKLLVERVESIISADIARTTSEKYKANSEVDKNLNEINAADPNQ